MENTFLEYRAKEDEVVAFGLVNYEKSIIGGENVVKDNIFISICIL